MCFHFYLFFLFLVKCWLPFCCYWIGSYGYEGGDWEFNGAVALLPCWILWCAWPQIITGSVFGNWRGVHAIVTLPLSDSESRGGFTFWVKVKGFLPAWSWHNNVVPCHKQARAASQFAPSDILLSCQNLFVVFKFPKYW